MPSPTKSTGSPFRRLHRILAADETEVTPQLDQEFLESQQQAAMQIGFHMTLRQIEKLASPGIVEHTPFVPALTVIVDCGNAPFLWLVDGPEEGGGGGKLRDGTYWDDSFLLGCGCMAGTQRQIQRM